MRYVVMWGVEHCGETELRFSFHSTAEQAMAEIAKLRAEGVRNLKISDAEGHDAPECQIAALATREREAANGGDRDKKA